MSLSPGGLLNGTPATPGSYSVNVNLTDAAGVTAPSSFPLVVSAPGPLTVSGGKLNDTPQFVPTSQPLTASGGTPPYTWTLEGGSFPDGVTLDPWA